MRIESLPFNWVSNLMMLNIQEYVSLNLPINGHVQTRDLLYIISLYHDKMDNLFII